MSVNITIDHAVKKYGENTVIPDLNLHIRDGELFTLLGPSGCGKTTLLRMIAGFNSIEGGTFAFNGTVINDMDPGRRNIGMVFQNYAIFPNMSVRKNVEFGMKNRNFPRGEIRAEAEKFLRLVHVDAFADRMPSDLSGGQQQRVALARALCVRPDVLLMDEPLSNLDAKLRVEMRGVIKRIQKEVGITTVYVTHDQEEAMAISDRIAVMKLGVIHHCGRPQDIYMRPADTFVASFIGKSNLLRGKLSPVQDAYTLEFADGFQIRLASVDPEKAGTQTRDVTVSCRPEELLIRQENGVPVTDGPGIHAVIRDSVFLGLNTHYFVELDTGEEAEIVQESNLDAILPPGTAILLSVNAAKINCFAAGEDGQSLMSGVRNSVDASDIQNNVDMSGSVNA